MRQALSLLLTTILVSGNALAQGGGRAAKPPIKDQLQAIGTGRPVEVRLQSNARLRGWLRSISETGFLIETVDGAALKPHTLTFEQVRAVKAISNVEKSHTLRNVLLGVGIGVGALVLITLIVVARGLS